MFKALIIDDEATARDVLESHISKIDTVEVVASCGNAAEGFSVLSKEKIDIVFLDINMPEVTGLMFAKAIQGKTQIIFTTAYRDYALDGYEVAALDYLLKPISLERFMTAVNKLVALREIPKEETPHDFTFFRCDRKMVKVNFEDILFIEGCGDYLKIHLINDVLISRETITNVLEKIPSQQFIRTHRSYVAAISKIKSYTNEYIEIQKKTIPISRSYREYVLKILNKFS